MVRDYPDIKQRNAVCFSQWRKVHGGTPPAGHAEMTEIMLYEDIGDGDSTAKAVLKALQALKPSDPITVAIYSSGGSFFEGEAIYAALKRHRGRVTVRIDGVAASAASYIAMAGDEIVMAPGSHMMIHRAAVSGYMRSVGEDDLIDLRARLDTMNKQMARVYAMRSGQDETKVVEMMRAESWLTAEQCSQLGFCDRIDDELQLKPAAGGDLAKYNYRHVPVAVQALTGLASTGAAQEDTGAAQEDIAKTANASAQTEPSAKASSDDERQRRARWKRRHAIIAGLQDA